MSLSTLESVSMYRSVTISAREEMRWEAESWGYPREYNVRRGTVQWCSDHDDTHKTQRSNLITRYNDDCCFFHFSIQYQESSMRPSVSFGGWIGEANKIFNTMQEKIIASTIFFSAHICSILRMKFLLDWIDVYSPKLYFHNSDDDPFKSWYPPYTWRAFLYNTVLWDRLPEGCIPDKPGRERDNPEQPFLHIQVPM